MTKYALEAPEPTPALPSAMQPAVDLGIKGMRVVLMRAREPHGTVLNSYDDSVLGPRAYVLLDNNCSGWVSIDDLEPEE